jgi:hypothetical protein
MQGKGPKTLPDVMLVGAAKSGTTSIAHQFLLHPEVFIPLAKKEPHYFSFAGQPPAYDDHAFVDTLVWDMDRYEALYRDAAPGQLIADCSTSYLYLSDKAVPNIRSAYGERAADLQVMAVLRDPVERAYSHWMYLVRNGHEDLPFEEAIRPGTVARRKGVRWGFDYLGYGEYAGAVQRFKDAFPRFKVFLFEDLRDQQGVFDQICDLLRIGRMTVAPVRSNPGGIPKNRGVVRLLRRNNLLRTLSHWAPSGVRAKLRAGRDGMLRQALDRPEMSNGARTFLADHYKEDVERLATIIGRDLDHWCNT